MIKLYIIFQRIVMILDIFNNPIGISALIIAIVSGIYMVRNAKSKSILLALVCFLLVGIVGFLACVGTNNIDYLFAPIFAIPFVVVLTICYFVKLITKKDKA